MKSLNNSKSTISCDATGAPLDDCIESVNISGWANEYGFKVPVFMSRKLWEAVATCNDNDSLDGRMHSFLESLARAKRGQMSAKSFSFATGLFPVNEDGTEIVVNANIKSPNDGQMCVELS